MADMLADDRIGKVTVEMLRAYILQCGAGADDIKRCDTKFSLVRFAEERRIDLEACFAAAAAIAAAAELTSAAAPPFMTTLTKRVKQGVDQVNSVLQVKKGAKKGEKKSGKETPKGAKKGAIHPKSDPGVEPASETGPTQVVAATQVAAAVPSAADEPAAPAVEATGTASPEAAEGATGTVAGVTVDAPAEEASELEAEAPQLAEVPAPEAEAGIAEEAVPAPTDAEPFVEAVSEVAVEGALEAAERADETSQLPSKLTERADESSLLVDVAEREPADSEPEPGTVPEVEAVPHAASEAEAAVAVADRAAVGPEADGATPEADGPLPEESPVAVE
jgi:hypothetical protein